MKQPSKKHRVAERLKTPEAAQEWFERDWPWMLVLVCVSLYMYWPQLTEQAFFWFDMLFQVCIRKEQGALALAHGRIPLWDPTIYCGAPFLADPTNSVFYPFHLLLALLTKVAGEYRFVFLVYIIVLETMVCACGMYVLLRRVMGMQAVAACLSAAAYTFSTAMVSRLVQYAHYTVMIMIPLVLLALARLRKGGAGSVLFAGTLWGITLLGDNQQYMYYLGLAMLCHGVYDIWCAWRAGERWQRLLVRYVSTAAIGVGLGAVMLLPVAEYARLAGRSFSEPSGTPVKYLMTYVAPGMFGTLRGEPAAYFGHEGFWNYWEYSSYVGIVTLVLAVWSCWLCRAHAYWRYAAGLCLGVWLCAYGVNNPLPRLMPMGGSFRIPGKLLIFAAYGLSVMAGLGLDRLLRDAGAGARARSALVMCMGIVGAALCACGVWLWQHSQGAAHTSVALHSILRSAMMAVGACVVLWWYIARQARGGAWAACALIGLLLVDLAGFNRGFNMGRVDPRAFYRSHPVIDYVRAMMKEEPVRIYAPSLTAMNLRGTHFGIHTIDGFSALEPPWYRDLKALRATNDERFLDLCNCAVTMDERGNVRRRPGALRRAELIGALRVVAPEKMTNVLAASQFDPRREALIEPAYAAYTAHVHRAAVSGTVTWIAYQPEYMAVVITAAVPTFAVFSECRYPGWIAYTNGATAAWVPVNLNFRALPVPAGVTTVAWYYRPLSFYIGAGVSAATGLGVALAAGLAWYAQYRRT